MDIAFQLSSIYMSCHTNIKRLEFYAPSVFFCYVTRHNMKKKTSISLD